MLNKQAIGKDTGKPDDFVNGALYISGITIPALESTEQELLTEIAKDGYDERTNGAYPDKSKNSKQIKNAIIKLERYLKILKFLYHQESVLNGNDISSELNIPDTTVYLILKDLREDTIALVNYTVEPLGKSHEWYVINKEVVSYLLGRISELQEEFATCAHTTSPKAFLQERVKQIHSDKK